MVYGILEILIIKLVPVEMNHIGFVRGRGMKKIDCSFVELDGNFKQCKNKLFFSFSLQD